MNHSRLGVTAGVTLFLTGFAAGCGDQPPPLTAQETPASCELEPTSIELPGEVYETSGLAASHRQRDLFWTHNDRGHEPELFAITAAGALAQRVRVTGADLVDWEDIESGPCGDVACLYIGDIGDNGASREQITIYRVVEPAAGATESAPAAAYHARYPSGPRDAEGFFRHPSGDLYIVTKGRDGPVELYRFPLISPGETITLEHVRDLLPMPADGKDLVTAATATLDGRWAAVRSYRTLYLYPLEPLVAGTPVQPDTVDLTPLGHKQGESIALLDDGTGWVTTEAENEGSRPALGRLRCTLPE